MHGPSGCKVCHMHRFHQGLARVESCMKRTMFRRAHVERSNCLQALMSRAAIRAQTQSNQGVSALISPVWIQPLQIEDHQHSEGTRLGRVARMLDGPVGKQLFFAEGLVGLSGVAGIPCSMWRDGAFTALIHSLNSDSESLILVHLA
eukprot:364808-Chlamydomonas_euryale.AAC.13